MAAKQSEVVVEAGADQTKRQGLRSRRWLIIAAAGVVSAILIFSRRPDALLNPQFLAEDGTYFYAQTYNLGPLRALGIPVAGYLVTSGRLAALIAVAFPLAWGPAIFNLLGITVQSAPVLFLFTRRFDRLIPNWYARAALAFFYLALPNSLELDVAITNAQWHLALLALLVVIAETPTARGWQVFDGCIVLLAGLSAPLCFALAPVIALRWLRARDRRLVWLFALNLLACAVQAATLLTTTASARSFGSPDMDGIQLARIIAGQVFVAATVGIRVYALIGASSGWAAGWAPVAVAVAGLAFLGAALRRAPQELRLLWLFGALTLVAALVSETHPGPGPTNPGTYWQFLARPGWNMRYEFLLLIAWFATLVWIMSSRPKAALRRMAFFLLTFSFVVAIPLDWSYPPFVDYHYQTYLAQFERMPAGSQITIPIYPAGWTMTLIKR